MTLRTPTSFVLVLTFAATGARAADEDATPYDSVLRRAGVEPTAEGVRGYLESVVPTAARERRVRELIEQLGSTDFREREAASRGLLHTPHVSQALLREATESDDAEVRFRARRVIARIDRSEALSTLSAALRVVERRKWPGFAPLLLDLLPQWTDRYLREAAVRAIVASATQEDVPRLRKSLKDEHGPVRLAAVGALAKLLGPDFDEDLSRIASRDEDGLVRIRALTALLDRGRREPLARLVALLESEELATRTAAGNVLRSATGRQFGYAAYDAAERRAKAVRAWEDWLRNEPEAELRLPVERRRVEIGRTLVGVWSEKTLRDFDANGQSEKLADGFSYLWGCHALPGGRRLAVDYQQKLVVEYDARGKETFRQELPGKPTGVEGLFNGHVLVALAEPGLVVQLDRGGKVVWQQKLEGRPTTAQRLDNGHTVVCLQKGGRVVEIDRQGKVVWQVDDLKQPHTAQALPNGHVLVLEMSPRAAAVEYDRDGNVVWSKDGFNNPAQAQRLANGHTMVSDADGLHVYDAAGKRVRHVQLSRSRFWHY